MKPVEISMAKFTQKHKHGLDTVKDKDSDSDTNRQDINNFNGHIAVLPLS
jgi:hypothetical protein